MISASFLPKIPSKSPPIIGKAVEVETVVGWTALVRDEAKAVGGAKAEAYCTSRRVAAAKAEKEQVVFMLIGKERGWDIILTGAYFYF